LSRSGSLAPWNASGTSVAHQRLKTRVLPLNLWVDLAKANRPREEGSHPETPFGDNGVTTLHQNRESPRLRIQTILDHVEKFKSFVYGEASLEERGDGLTLVVQMVARKNSRVFCSGCGRPGPVYDRPAERQFEFVPLWGISVFLAYRMRRVNCKRCGVTVKMVQWCDGKNQLTTTYRWFLATWAKRLS
jgi:ribosomal protein S27AE